MIDDSAIEDMRIIEFARRWLPYGGGTTGDLLVEFGMTPACYIARLNSILAGPTANQLDPTFRDDLRRFVSLRASRPAPTA
ncbi:DUF3263 domain-containing protein [Rhodococcus opacus]|uniref:DUF3263 domain-containing protein n=1 Tax=Rhodococcus TaxID=1827 RepID=UPI0013200EAE|nr:MULTISPECIES: DUF3263 domain-containing protein [Rhodococcus]MDJ0420129.1 DUF3263 domain-containing protein [Rhodococcus opacus]MDV7089030.1 DUF3263 domain-containing protein [Rhodococcus opacus]QHE73557.1 hypothetical protein GFS60_07217 [Rhodococcus sp. WAY2]UNN04654.1 DUF3263 domain-containing protein [Rhodococcus opacus]WKN52452.1 DUF3263 domain-containing protein [Rhodococcus opacus]